MVSVWHQSTARAIRKHRIRLLSYRSRGTVMSYTDHSVQRRLKSNAPIDSPDSFKNTESFSNKTPLCVARRCATVLLWLCLKLFSLVKTVNNVSKCKSVNINYLFNELPLNKINVTFAIMLVLGRVMLLTYIRCYIEYLSFFLPQYVCSCLFLCVCCCAY